MLAVNIIWIVVGIIYIIYRLIKDGEISRAFSILMLPLFFILISRLPDSLFSKFMLAVICITSPIWVGLILFGFYRNKDSDSEKDALNILESMHQYGYKNVLLEDVELFFTESPPRLVKSPYYDTDKRNLDEMWDWLCKEKTYELINKEDCELSQIIGINIENIPLNPKLQIKEAYFQRKCKVVDRILTNRGLVYRKHFGGDREYNLINSSSEYNLLFDNYIRNYNSEHNKPETP